MMLYARRHTPCTRVERERGSVLVIVMWIAMVLITLALYFGHSMTVEFKASDNRSNDVVAAQATEGVRRYIAFAYYDGIILPGRAPDLETFLMEQIPIGNATAYIIGRSYSLDYAPTEPTFALIPENAKLDLNFVTQDMLELLPNMPEGLAARIIDWRDEDEEITEGGAESQDYLLSDVPYYAKNFDFESIEELRFVMGEDWEYFLGEDTNLNGVLDPNEDDGDLTPPYDNQDGKLDYGILEYVTIYSREPLTLWDGTARLNVSEDNGSEEMLTLLEEALGDENRASEINGYVNGQSFTSVLEFYMASSMSVDEFRLVEGYLYHPDPNEDVAYQSDQDQGGQGQGGQDQGGQNQDQAATGEGTTEYLYGLINVNMASPDVLFCVLQDEALVEAIVNYRESMDPAYLNTVAWVAEALQGDYAAAQYVGPYITGNCFIFTADIAAVGKRGRGFSRVAYVIDTSTEIPQVLNRRDRSGMTWPLGATIRSMSRTLTEDQGFF